MDSITAAARFYASSWRRVALQLDSDHYTFVTSASQFLHYSCDTITSPDSPSVATCLSMHEVTGGGSSTFCLLLSSLLSSSLSPSLSNFGVKAALSIISDLMSSTPPLLQPPTPLSLSIMFQPPQIDAQTDTEYQSISLAISAFNHFSTSFTNPNPNPNPKRFLNHLTFVIVVGEPTSNSLVLSSTLLLPITTYEAVRKLRDFQKSNASNASNASNTGNTPEPLNISSVHDVHLQKLDNTMIANVILHLVELKVKVLFVQEVSEPQRRQGVFWTVSEQSPFYKKMCYAEPATVSKFERGKTLCVGVTADLVIPFSTNTIVIPHHSICQFGRSK